jgi:2-C-methyl-D-erythritol 4-phosphate cytidylyltransferase
LILAVASEWQSKAQDISNSLELRIPLRITAGGEERQDSVAAGLALVGDSDLVLVHDAARPFATLDLFNRCIEAAAESGAAIAALPAKDTIKVATHEQTIRETIDRSGVWLAQTPQVFRVDLLKRAYEQARRDKILGTDEAALVERLGASVRLVAGEEANRKITTPDDLEWAEWYAKRQ